MTTGLWKLGKVEGMERIGSGLHNRAYINKVTYKGRYHLYCFGPKLHNPLSVSTLQHKCNRL